MEIRRWRCRTPEAGGRAPRRGDDRARARVRLRLAWALGGWRPGPSPMRSNHRSRASFALSVRGRASRSRGRPRIPGSSPGRADACRLHAGAEGELRSGGSISVRPARSCRRLAGRRGNDNRPDTRWGVIAGSRTLSSPRRPRADDEDRAGRTDIRPPERSSPQHPRGGGHASARQGDDPADPAAGRADRDARPGRTEPNDARERD